MTGLYSYIWGKQTYTIGRYLYIYDYKALNELPCISLKKNYQYQRCISNSDYKSSKINKIKEKRQQTIKENEKESIKKLRKLFSYLPYHRFLPIQKNMEIIQPVLISLEASLVRWSSSEYPLTIATIPARNRNRFAIVGM